MLYLSLPSYYLKRFVMKWSSKLKYRVIKIWFKCVSDILTCQNPSDFLLLKCQFHTAPWKMGEGVCPLGCMSACLTLI